MHVEGPDDYVRGQMDHFTAFVCRQGGSEEGISVHVEEPLSDQLQKVRDMLAGCGPKTSLEISRALGIHRTSVRSSIRALIQRGIPIGSSSDGYFMIESEQQLQDTTHGLEKRLDAIQRRIDALEDGFDGVNSIQS